MIEEIQGTVFGNFGSHLNQIWGVGDGLERKCSRQREKDVQGLEERECSIFWQLQVVFQSGLHTKCKSVVDFLREC